MMMMMKMNDDDDDNNDDVAVVPQKKTHTPLCCACATGSTQLAERREPNSAAAQSMQSPHCWGYHNFHTKYPLVIADIAIEHGYLQRFFIHKKWWIFP
jgi:hypothetical protein